MDKKLKPLTMYTDDIGFHFGFYPDTLDIDVDSKPVKTGKIKVTVSFECDDIPEIKSETIRLLRYQRDLLKQAVEGIKEKYAEELGIINSNIIPWEHVIRVAKRKADFDTLEQLNRDYPDIN